MPQLVICAVHCGGWWLHGDHSSMVRVLAAQAGQMLPVFHFSVIDFINETACLLEAYQNLRILEQLKEWLKPVPEQEWTDTDVVPCLSRFGKH